MELGSPAFSLFAACAATILTAGVAAADLPGVGWPHEYPGMPQGDYSPEWQAYFEVKEPLPNVTFSVNRNWAGNVGVNRPGHPNDTLFFWAFEKELGSMTAEADERQDEPWGIWLNGGPGSSSMVGLLYENGPIHVADDFSLYRNWNSWDRLADYVWVDQPVGVGFSTVDNTSFVVDEDQMGLDFMNFLANLVKVYPSLATRPLHITGESYAGYYIPYILKTYFGMENPPVKIAKVAIGDGSIGTWHQFEDLPVLTMLQTYPQLIGYDQEVFKYFKEQTHLCGFDLNFTYPQNGYFPPLNPPVPGPSMSSPMRAQKDKLVVQALQSDGFMKRSLSNRRSLERRIHCNNVGKRELFNKVDDIDPFYGCGLWQEMIDYALNYSIPWKGNTCDGFDVYNIPDALDPEGPRDASIFLNFYAARRALHAPTSKDWVETITYPFASTINKTDPSIEPMSFFTELATNASIHGVGIVIYSGNDDSIVSHRSSEVVIQNTTFGGIQGFTRQPSTHWYDDDGQFAGIVHQERNWTYVLIKGAGHLVPWQQPGRAFVLLREFVLGNNETGLVTTSGGQVTVIGGEDKSYAGVLTGQSGIYSGSGKTEGTYTYPSSTIAAWESFIATETATPTVSERTSVTPYIAARTAL